LDAVLVDPVLKIAHAVAHDFSREPNVWHATRIPPLAQRSRCDPEIICGLALCPQLTIRLCHVVTLHQCRSIFLRLRDCKTAGLLSRIGFLACKIGWTQCTTRGFPSKHPKKAQFFKNKNFFKKSEFF